MPCKEAKNLNDTENDFFRLVQTQPFNGDELLSNVLLNINMHLPKLILKLIRIENQTDVSKNLEV